MIRITKVTRDDVRLAGKIHAESWRDSHRAFCTPEFVALHTTERQTEYLSNKLAGGTEIFLLTDNGPAGIVSVTGSLIEDLYVLPECQSRGYGTALLKHAVTHCAGSPVLWILENNTRAEKWYRKFGFVPTGKVNAVTTRLSEREFILQSKT